MNFNMLKIKIANAINDDLPNAYSEVSTNVFKNYKDMILGSKEPLKLYRKLIEQEKRVAKCTQ